MELEFSELRDFLNEKVLQYNRPEFIELDPIQIPHLYEEKEDIEIAGFGAGEYDVLNVLGDIHFGDESTIQFSFIEGYVPQANDTFDFLTYASLDDGWFSETIITGLIGFDFDYKLIFDNGSVRMAWLNTESTEPVPEPTTMLLFGSGLIGLAGFRRKFWKK